MNKEFEEKFTHTQTPSGGRLLYNDITPIELWQWIEQQLIQARVDELKYLTRQLNDISRPKYISPEYLRNRIKELKDE